ncbi:MAG: phosphohistidine phosphatase SixA [Gemmatimonadaceae bacterium]
MDLLIVRHGIAEDKVEFAKTGKSDDERPLTAKGRKKMKRSARGLRELIPQLGLIATSPLLRAMETAAIVSEAYAAQVGAVAEELRPDAPFSVFIDWLRPLAEKSPVAVVGHEPHLSGLATWLMCGSKESRLELGKGGACLLTFDGAIERGAASLCWLLTSKQLEALG